MEARESKEGAVVSKSGLDPHKSLFSQFLYAIDNSFWNLKDPSLYNDPSLLSNPSLMLDPLGKPLFIGVINVDPTTNPIKAFGATNPMAVEIADPANAAFLVQTTSTTIEPLSSNRALCVSAMQVLLDPVSGNLVRYRACNKSKFAACTTVAATAVWTPAAGKRFRLMGGVIVCSAGLAAAGNQQINLLDAAVDIGVNFATFLPIAASVTGLGIHVIPFDLRPNGILSALANNVLNCTMTSAVTAGAINITVWGTEE
jgi:hypothetical protein